mgnify:CR=1 FL=1
MKVNRNYIEKTINEITSTITEVLSLTSKPFEELSKSELMALRYYLIVISEALSSLALHIVRRALNTSPSTPIEAFRILRNSNLITSSELDDIASLMRLRNLLVHRYWVIDDKIIYDNIKKDFKKILSAVKKIAKQIQVL